MSDNKVQHEWAKADAMRVVDMSQDYFLVQFVDEEDYRYTLFKGLWMIESHYIIVQRWHSVFIINEKKVQKIVA
uniref:DUF4283 domain-containing protein n=1 Tax=Cajanus cajan TaxID=3821 RepID=A0A151QRA0_CAJCA|nr:hypothetical protein KK1_046387 [Cajanus cajan]